MKGETPSYLELAVGRERSKRGLLSFGPGIQQAPLECGGLPPPLTSITTLRKLSRSLRPAPEVRHARPARSTSTQAPPRARRRATRILPPPRLTPAKPPSTPPSRFAPHPQTQSPPH